MSGKPQEPNEIADRYEVTNNLRYLLRNIIESSEGLTEDGDHPVSEYHRRVKSLCNELGKAQRDYNQFSIKRYREEYADELPTVRTVSAFHKRELSVLVGMGILEWDDEVPLPVDESGDRLPIFVASSDEVDECLGAIEPYRDAIPSQRSVKILHVADTHLGYSRRPEERKVDTSDELNAAQAFERVGEIAVKQDVDAVVHAGDIFDDNVGKEHLRVFEEVVGRLDEAGIGFYFVIGNHGARTANGPGINAVARLMSMHERGELRLLSREPAVLGDGLVSLSD